MNGLVPSPPGSPSQEWAHSHHLQGLSTIVVPVGPILDRARDHSFAPSPAKERLRRKKKGAATTPLREGRALYRAQREFRLSVLNASRLFDEKQARRRGVERWGAEEAEEGFIGPAPLVLTRSGDSFHSLDGGVGAGMGMGMWNGGAENLAEDGTTPPPPDLKKVGGGRRTGGGEGGAAGVTPSPIERGKGGRNRRTNSGLLGFRVSGPERLGLTVKGGREIGG